LLHCLSYYPNEYWKYPVSVFFLKNKGSNDFNERFCEFLSKLLSFLFAKYIEYPTVNAIKDDVYGICIGVESRSQFETDYSFNGAFLQQEFVKHSSGRFSRALLLLDAYLNPNQKSVISDTFDIEHIFPKRWQDTNYNGWSVEDAKAYLDRFGNKIVFEKKLNIQAGNGYFGMKKLRYAASGIASVKDLANYPDSDWVKMDIELREIDLKDRIVGFFHEQLVVNAPVA
jgi:hypothetical protein